jgi:AAA15 family ATPase/GTPase
MFHLQFFNGSLAHSIASQSFNPQVMGSNLKKSKNFKKAIRFCFWLKIGIFLIFYIDHNRVKIQKIAKQKSKFWLGILFSYGTVNGISKLKARRNLLNGEAL